MDSRNGGDPLVPPRPPKSFSHTHHPRAPELSMMNTPLAPVQREEQQSQSEFQIQQQQKLCTNSSLYNIRTSDNHNSISSTNNNFSNNNNNINIDVNNSVGANRRDIGRLNNNSSSNSNNFNNNFTIQLATLAAPLLPHQSQQNQTLNIINSVSSTTITSINNSTRRRPLPPIINLPLLPSISSNIHSAESPVSPVTLAAPRPESERLANEYVDTPFRTTQQLHNASRHQHPAGQTIHGQTTTQHNLLQFQSQRQHQHISSNNHQSSGTTASLISENSPSTLLHSNNNHKNSKNTTSSFDNTQTTTSATTLLLSGQTQRHQFSIGRSSVLPITEAVTKQPVSFAKDTPHLILLEDHDHHISSGEGARDFLNSITCPQCKKCRCEQCQSPRQLPSRWVCNKTCLCSAETVIDYASCLCCVKALFYHCAKDHEMECDDGDSISCADDPCSCLPHKRVARWSWLCALSLALPCLWCYWPMKGCVTICAKCYARHSRHGCQCQSVDSTTMLSISPIGSTVGLKPAGGNDAISQNDNSHHLSNNEIGNSGNNGSGEKTLKRVCEFTPEKKLLDSNSEY